MPRLVLLIVTGLFLVAPWLRAGLAPPGPAVRRAFRGVLVVVILGFAPAGWSLVHRGPGQIVAYRGQILPPPTPSEQAVAADWTHYGATAHGTRYSPLDEITPANVATLRRAWSYASARIGPDGKVHGVSEITPLMADGAVYGCTEAGAVFALDPVTGRELWRYDPPETTTKGPFGVCRGLAFYRAPQAPADCSTRLLMGTTDDRLVALDAKTGRLCGGFGPRGK